MLAAVSLPVLGKFLMPRFGPKTSGLRVKKDELPGGGALVFAEKKIAVIQRGTVVYALGLTCTHLGCTVNATPKGFVCPCHGSAFGLDGRVFGGPADRPLQRMSVEEDGEDLVVS